MIQIIGAIGFEGGGINHGWNDDMTRQRFESRVETRDDNDAGPAQRVRGRFAKGSSGNPAGRPSGRRATGAPGDRLPGSDQPTRAMILEEAYRLVRLGEGDAAIELPAHRAVFRSLTEAAMKGNQAALRRWTQMVQQAENDQMRDQLALYNLMERAPYGREPEASYEDDILVDSRSGRVIIRGGYGEEGGGVK